MRTTIDLDPVILRELKERGAKEGKTLGQLASELLAPALKRTEPQPAPEFVWHSQAMGLLVDLEDKDALYAILDSDWYGDQPDDE
jgi:hypothetical protein